MDKGFLVFELKKDNGASPITEAQVKLTNIDGRDVNRVFRVNNDGKTEMIDVYTRDAKLTFDQLNKEIPYTKIDAEVRLENDKIVQIDGIQVYPNVVSIQEVKLDNRKYTRHHKDKKGKLKKEHIHIKNENPCIFNQSQVLKDKKVLIDSDNDVSLFVKNSDVFIPQFITIHLGEPEDEGEVLTIPFIDYIKNVVCSNIYPTWNKEAIKANAYAATTFALNRMHSNFYRSKGYGFEITSSKDHDQMYVKGRTLFRNVCDIVDDIFDKYIDLDGSMVLSRCENKANNQGVLSRWGSLSLSEDGLTAIDILKKYYGDDIKIMDVPKIEAVLKKCPSRELYKDMNGEDVTFLQKALNAIGLKYLGISKINSITGHFGNETERAVKDFQRIFDLDVDGIVGPKTWKKICVMYAILKQLYPELIVKDTVPSYKVLKFGDKGEDVKKLQEDLNMVLKGVQGFKRLNEDGIFGGETERAVMMFQKMYGLTVDGIVGPNTLGKIEYAKKFLDDVDKMMGYYIFSETGTPYQIVKEARSYNDLSKIRESLPIKNGDKGDDVRLIQISLNRFGDYYNLSNDHISNGIFDDKMENIVKEFQRKSKLRATGIIDTESFDRLISINKSIEEFRAITNNIYREILRDNTEVGIKIPLKFGDTGESVYLLQKALNRLARYYGFLYHIKEDGIYGEETQNMVSKFQKYLLLKVDGVFGKDSLAKLKSILNLLNHLDELDPEVCKNFTDLEGNRDDNYYKGKYTVNINLPLHLGNEGEDVEILQRELNKLISNYNGYLLDVDGKYGEHTMNVVMRLQKKLGLPVTGVFGEEELEKLSSLIDELKELGYMDDDSTNSNHSKHNGMPNCELYPVNNCPNASSYPVDSNYINNVKDIEHKDGDTFIELDTGTPPNYEGSYYYSDPNNITGESEDLDSYRHEENNINPSDFRGEYSMEYPNFDLEYGCVSGYVTLVQKYINSIKDGSRGYFRSNATLNEDGVFGDNTLIYINELQDKFRCNKGKKIDKTTWNRLLLEYEKLFK